MRAKVIYISVSGRAQMSLFTALDAGYLLSGKIAIYVEVAQEQAPRQSDFYFNKKLTMQGIRKQIRPWVG